MSENVLITGITGSGGSYLAEYILENHPNVNVFGMCRWHSTTTYDNINNIKDKIDIKECDLMDISSVIRALQIIKPTKIFHLAAYANVRKCFDTPLAVINNNITGTANLLEAIRLVCPETLLQMCSTSEVYGNPIYTPIDENHPLRPVNPYAVSKLTQESLAYAYYQSWGIRVIITRMFSYINPRRAELFQTAFAYQVAKIEKGLQDKLYHGNLQSIRNIIDVRDAMESYWIASEKCQLGEPYNIGGDNVLTIYEFIQRLCKFSTDNIKLSLDNSLLRPIDVTYQIPDSTKFRQATGWQPKYNLDESIQHLLDFCRNKINGH